MRQRLRRVWLVSVSWCLVVGMSGACSRAQSPNAPAQDVAQTAEPATEKTEPRIILFLGNSLTAGLGVNQDQAFPALIQEEINARGWNYEVINAGVSGDTSAGGLRRLDWLLQRRIDVLVLELGANDGLRGVPAAETGRNLQSIIDKTRDAYPGVRIVIAGMKLPPNLGSAYTAGFEAVFPELAKKNRAALIPFLLEGVAADPTLNLLDRIHPSPEGHEIVSRTVWKTLEPILKEQL